MENISGQQTSSKEINFGPIFIAIAATTWTFDFIYRNIVLQYVTPTMLVMFEHIIMTIFVLPLLWKSKHLMTQFNRKEWIALLIIGVGASGLATILLSTGYTLGFEYAPMIALVQQLQPVIAIGLAHVMLKEELPNYYYLLTIFALAGVFLMYYPLVSAFSFSIVDNIGLQAAIYGLVAAALWGSGTVLGKYMLVHSETEMEYMDMASYRFFIGMVGLIILNAFLGFPIIAPFTGETIIGLLFLALVPGLLALVLYYYGLKSTHASVATLFELAFPLSFLILIPLITNSNPITPIQYVGAGILIVATTALSFIYGVQTTPEQFDLVEEIQ